ncbi:hypothetical protein LTR62_007939 [Meristemomyces frigidus]|uniref:Large ribosomal subunit protein uL30m n=1 Tax=Meristemomyces frigidus TaxID=1508187 RepID=A0AAN7TUS3_9PEZI|nr:hypothetical protein LTR62_007939 [Meristemomyces frigidus]
MSLTTPSVRFFRITLLRSAIGLPKRTAGVLAALGLHKRLRTVYHPVTQDVAGQIFAVKELVDVQEVDQKLSDGQMRELRRPGPGFWVEKRVGQQAQEEVERT